MGLDRNHELLWRWCLEDSFGACEVNSHFLQDHPRNRVVKYHKRRIEQEYMVECAVCISYIHVVWGAQRLTESSPLSISILSTEPR